MLRCGNHYEGKTLVDDVFRLDKPSIMYIHMLTINVCTLIVKPDQIVESTEFVARECLNGKN